MSPSANEMQPVGVKYRMMNEQQEVPNDDIFEVTKVKRIDWRCPFIMYGSLLAGLAFAIGHYAFYAHLNTMLVDTTVSQTWVNRIGTAFAFLVKMFFVIAAATAFVQRQWYIMGSTTLKVSELDSLTGILNNLFNLLDGLFWFRYPLLACIAVVTWLIPIAAIISPGAITVTSTGYVTTHMAQVPQLSFSNYLDYGEVAANGVWAYQRPQARLSRVAYASATTGQILSRKSPFENDTYVISFFAPALRCDKANSSLSAMVRNNTYQFEKDVGQSWDFIAWVGGDDHGIGSSNTSEWNPDAVYLTLDSVSQDAARLFIATLDYKPNGTGVPPTSTYECQSWNASYQVQFSSSSALQQTEILSISYLNGVPKAGLNSTSYYEEPEVVSYNAIVDAFSRLLVGYVFHDRHGWLMDSSYTSSSLLTSIDWYNNGTISRSVETLFNNITMSLLGTNTFLRNTTEADAVPVDVTTYPLTYAFKPRDLVLAYGISLLIAILATLVGTHAMFVNRACYRNMFSTFVRTTRDSTLAALISPTDTGADPLPRHIADSKIRFRRRSGEDDEQ